MDEYKTYDTAWLKEQMESGTRQKFVYFWGHSPRADNAVTKACFSQWWSSPYEVGDHRYATAEHWMMAEKARLFDHEEKCSEILQSEDPGKAKALGRQVLNFDQKIWNKYKYDIAVRGNFHKFSQNKDLGEFLRNTGKRVLVEASPVDKIWGVGLAQDDRLIENPRTWRGHNLLGFALMSVRDIL